MIDYSNKTLSQYIETAEGVIYTVASKYEKENFTQDLDYQVILLGCVLQMTENDYEQALEVLKTDAYLTLNLADKQALDEEYSKYADYRDNDPNFEKTKLRATNKLQEFVNILKVHEQIQKRNKMLNIAWEDFKANNTKEQDEEITNLIKEAIEETGNLYTEDNEDKKEDDEKKEIMDQRPCPVCGKMLYRYKGINSYRGYRHDLSKDILCTRTFLTLEELEKATLNMQKKKAEKEAKSENNVTLEEPKEISKEDFLKLNEEQSFIKNEEENKMGFKRLKTNDGSKRIAVTADEPKESYDAINESNNANENIETEEYATENLTDEDNATMLLDDMEEKAATKMGYLCSSEGTVIEINLPYFKIGKKRDCQMVLPNAAISREHAAIIAKNDTIYIKDLNSLNGTFINGYKLIPNAETEIKDGQEIMFANLKYTYKQQV